MRYRGPKGKGTKGVGKRNKMAGLYREKPQGERQPSPWAGEFTAEGCMCQPYPVTGRD